MREAPRPTSENVSWWRPFDTASFRYRPSKWAPRTPHGGRPRFPNLGFQLLFDDCARSLSTVLVHDLGWALVLARIQTVGRGRPRLRRTSRWTWTSRRTSRPCSSSRLRSSRGREISAGGLGGCQILSPADGVERLRSESASRTGSRSGREEGCRQWLRGQQR